MAFRPYNISYDQNVEEHDHNQQIVYSYRREPYEGVFIAQDGGAAAFA